VDLVAVDQNVDNKERYPFVFSRDGGAGNYDIEYKQRSAYFGALHPGDSYGPYTMGTGDLVDAFTFYSYGGLEPCIQIVPASGDALLGAAVFAAGAPTGRIYAREGAQVQSTAPAGGEPFKICPYGQTTGVYALVIWNNGGSQGTIYTIEIGDYEIRLPLVLK
jgi:hypothetical protein